MKQISNAGGKRFGESIRNFSRFFLLEVIYKPSVSALGFFYEDLAGLHTHNLAMLMPEKALS